MTAIMERPEAGFSYIPGVFQYSAGVASLPGFAIERVRFSRPVPMRAGFERISDFLSAAGRPLQSFCACELRSPGQFSEDAFVAFNRDYVGVLSQWGICNGDDNPVARSNVCPEHGAPSEPSFHAFSYTVEAGADARSFVIAGSGEAPEGKGNYIDHIIARGDVSAAGLRQKARWVLAEMERRMSAFAAGWRDVTGVQLYTVYDIHPFLADEMASRGVLAQGLTWHFCRPPVVGLDYEMDCRLTQIERVLEV